MSYHLRYSEDSRRDMRRLPGHLRHRARRLIEALADHPRPSGFRELRDHPGNYRLRRNGWRIFYRLDEDDQTVRILRVVREKDPKPMRISTTSDS